MYLTPKQQRDLLGAWYNIVGAEAPAPQQLAAPPPPPLPFAPAGSYGFAAPGFGGPMTARAVGTAYGAGWPIPPRNALIEANEPDHAGREVLPMSSGTEVPAGDSVQITSRPQRVAFRPERVFISQASFWVVNDIKIGNRSQFSQAGDVPADMFANNAIDSFVSFETAQTAMDVVMVVTNIDSETAHAFYGAIVGTAAI